MKSLAKGQCLPCVCKILIFVVHVCTVNYFAHIMLWLGLGIPINAAFSHKPKDQVTAC